MSKVFFTIAKMAYDGCYFAWRKNALSKVTLLQKFFSALSYQASPFRNNYKKKGGKKKKRERKASLVNRFHLLYVTAVIQFLRGHQVAISMETKGQMPAYRVLIEPKNQIALATEHLTRIRFTLTKPCHC